MITAGDIRFSEWHEEITRSEVVEGSLRLGCRLNYTESECIDARKMCVDKIDREINRKIYGDVVRDLLEIQREVRSLVGSMGYMGVSSNCDYVDGKFSELIAKLEWRDQ